MPTYNMLSNPPKQLATNSIPATFTPDKQAKVALVEFEPANWNSNTIRELLDDLLTQ